MDVVTLFITGYCAIVAGTYWWLKAKAWNKGVVLVELLPLGIIPIPCVRFMVMTSPWLVPSTTVLLSILLIVVVLALPDRSGRRHRHR